MRKRDKVTRARKIMSFTTTVFEVIARVEEHTKRQKLLDEKLLTKYRVKVNKHLLRMKTSRISIFFPYGNVELLHILANELEDAGFRARAHAVTDFGAYLYVNLPHGTQ